jgi:hypothetical protein
VKLVGPLGLGNGATPEWLAQVRKTGAAFGDVVSLETLAKEFAKAHVGIIPYAVNELTKGVDPLKRYEYLAAGLPVVSTALPSMTPVPGSVWVEPDPQSFARRVAALLREDSADQREERRTLAAQHGWIERGAEFRSLINRGLAGQPMEIRPGP